MTISTDTNAKKKDDKDKSNSNDFQPTKSNAVLDPNDEYDTEEQITQDEAIQANSSDKPFREAEHHSSEVDEKQQDANPSDDVTGKPFEDGFAKAGDETLHEIDSSEEREKNHPKYRTPNELDTAA